MPRVEVRLAELQEASVRFTTSANRIRDAIQSVSEMIDGMMAIGYESPAAVQAVLRFRTQRSLMEEWLDQLQNFATKLQESSEELERAIMKAPSVPTLVMVNHSTDTFLLTDSALAAMLLKNQDIAKRMNEIDPVEEPPPPETHTIDEFVSEGNQGLYDELADWRGQAHEVRAGIASLVQQREAVTTQLGDLETRLRSFNPDVNLDSIARVQTLRAQVAHLSAQISTSEANLRQIDSHIQHLITRLDRVKPGQGADLALIQHMVGAQSAEHIRSSTEGCVHYIVTRMAVPEGIPLDAHLWDEQAARFPQYGITVGNVPLQGSVLVLEPAHEYADDVYGHLMYVERVTNGDVWVTDNYHPNTPIRLSDITTELTGPNVHYLYFPWETRA